MNEKYGLDESSEEECNSDGENAVASREREAKREFFNQRVGTSVVDLCILIKDQMSFFGQV